MTFFEKSLPLMSIACFGLLHMLVELVLFFTQVGHTPFHMGYYFLSFVMTLCVIWCLEMALYRPTSGRLRQRPVLRVLLSVFWSSMMVFFICGHVVYYTEFRVFLQGTGLVFLFNDIRYLFDFSRDVLLQQGGWLPFGLAVAVLVMIRQAEHHFIRKKALTWTRTYPHQLIAVVLGAICCVVVLTKGKNSNMGMWPSTVKALGKSVSILSKARVPLHSSKRASLVKAPARKAPHVIWIIGESWGALELPAFGGEGADPMPKLSKRLATDTFVAFQHGFTNAMATEVSMSSMLTGVGPQEGSKKLHRMPLAWQWAKSAGVQSLYVTSQRYNWSNFDQFFFYEPPDRHRTALDIDSPIVNDTGMDDFVSLDVFVSELKTMVANDKPVFAVFNGNNLHAPFYVDTQEMNCSKKMENRYKSALFCHDVMIEKLFTQLEEMGIYDEAVIVFSADHGDLVGQKNKRRIHRTANHYREFAGIPIAIKLPKSWAKTHPKQVKQTQYNAKHRAVSNIDIVPTLITFWSDHPDNSATAKSLLGKSLLQPIDEARHVVVLSTNDTRQWNEEGFGIVHKRWHWVVSQKRKAELFDLHDDRAESQDLWHDPRAVDAKREMQKHARANPWLARVLKELKL